MKNINDTILSQYANSPTILSLIEQLNEIIDPAKNVEDFYELVWNVSTAHGLGLDIWGRIVGVDRRSKLLSPDTEVFGFNTNPQSFQPFDQASFMGSDANFSTYQLPDAQFRTLIMIKAASNVLYATAPNINRFLLSIFGKRCYFLLTGSMRATYYFEFSLNKFERYLIYELGILPVPCGVEIEYFEKEPWTDLLEKITNIDLPRSNPI